MFQSSEAGARTPVYIASSDYVVGVTGKFYLKDKETKTRHITYDNEVAAKLWEVREKLTGVKY